MKFVYGVGVMVILTAICLIGADLFAKTNLMILMMLLVSMFFAAISLLFQTPGIQLGYTGLSFKTLLQNLNTFQWQKDFENPSNTFSLQYAFGILFPSCTGIMVGANMSGDLKNPGHDIPTGTLMANVVTYFVYIGLSLLLAFTVTTQTLVSSPTVMMKVSFFPYIITMGIFAATLSSALGSIVGCSRIIQVI
jgi:solute carrier family 12 (potassium/chloride transporters), member 9